MFPEYIYKSFDTFTKIIIATGGVRRFNKSEFISGQQVASFFSRLTQNDKKCDSDDDYNAAAEEQVLNDLKLEIMATIESVKTPRRCRKKQKSS